MKLYQFASRLVQPVNRVPLFVFAMTLAAGIFFSQFCHAEETAPPVQNRVASYQLTASDMQALEKNAGLIDQVRDLPNQTFAAKSDIETAVGRIIDGAPEKYHAILLKLIKNPTKTTKDIRPPTPNKKYLDLVVTSAEKRVYQLSDRLIENLRKADMPADIMASIERLNSQEISKKADLIEEVTGIITFDAGIRQNDNIPAEVMEELRKLKADDGRNSKYIQERITYTLSDRALDDLKEKSVPETLISSLNDLNIIGITYSDKQVFEQEVKPALKNIKKADGKDPKSAEIQASFKISQKSVDFVVSELSKGNVPADILEKLDPFQHIEYPKEPLFKSAISSSIQNANAIEHIVNQARKEHALPVPKSSKEKFNARIIPCDACDCYRDDFSRLTYGFCPFWKIEKQSDEDPIQKADYSVLARIGLYSFPVDGNGRVHQKTIEWLQQIDRFFKTTHDYRTQVDLVLYNPNWRQWCERAKLPEYDTIDEFAANVVKVLAPSDRRATAWPRRKTTKLDGLTIDLNGFDDENWPYGIKLIKEIRENLQKTGHKYYLNLIIPGHEIKDIVDVLRHLERIIPEDEGQDDWVDHFIVFLKYPITDTKKALRNEIEERFKGFQRRSVLRKIIPVMNPYGHNDNNSKQLVEDLIYMEDNYGGVGFWPLPVVTDDAEPNLNALLREVFELEPGGDSAWANLTAMACTIICPNRWLVRIVWDIFVLLALASLVLYFSICGVREMMNKYFLFILAGVVLPFVFIGFGLLFCDPFYNKIAQGNGLLIFVILSLVVYAILNYRLKKKKADIP